MKWISVKERLPEAEGSCLVMSERGDVRLAWYYPPLNFDFVSKGCCFNGESVTHWMPMPDLPEEKS